ncbi:MULTISPECIES: LPS assembly lipoprotein LptE [unclassified Variovorax]|uniref:LPS-assembly lipoprotein LptE n=1 Tax=unclassified Variovorax TaxID=663243 RepID=UPI001BD5F30A|nr:MULTISPECIES: LPS assembly lipoprotein LptE [unclassified Variovorax]
MNRRSLLLGATFALAGCGFELRKAPNFAFKTIAVMGTSWVAIRLRRNLQAAGNVVVVPEADAKTADVIFDILAEPRESLVLSTTSAGQVRELTLRLTVRFRLRTPAGKELISAGEIRQSRDITYNETNALAKETEQNLLYRDMQNDIAQQIVRQLGAVKTL